MTAQNVELESYTLSIFFVAAFALEHRLLKNKTKNGLLDIYANNPDRRDIYRLLKPITALLSLSIERPRIPLVEVVPVSGHCASLRRARAGPQASPAPDCSGCRWCWCAALASAACVCAE